MAMIHDNVFIHIPVLLLLCFLCSKLYRMRRARPGVEQQQQHAITPSSSRSSDIKDNGPGGRYTEFGRQFHTYHKGIYPFPCDELEKERLDIYHQMFTEARNKQLFSAPIDTNKPFNVLDIGCGSGIWALDVVSEYKEASVIGLDISNLQPPSILKNLKFEVPCDIEDPKWPVGEDTFHLAHLRSACGTVSTWLGIYGMILRHLKPGEGYIEHVEIDFEPRCDDGSLSGTPITQWYNYVKAATRRMHRPVEYPSNPGEILRQAGYVDIKHVAVIRAPYNSWSNNPMEREIGRWHVVGMAETVETFSIKPFREAFGWDEKTVRTMIDNVKSAVVSRKVHAYSLIHIWTARRPGLNEARQ